MAELATRAYLVASLNIMVAARQAEGTRQAFTNDEIIAILFAMVESTSIAPDAYTHPKVFSIHGVKELL